MLNLKRVDAPQSTITYDKNKIDAQTGNIYEAISIIAKTNWLINWKNLRLTMITWKRFLKIKSK